MAKTRMFSLFSIVFSCLFWSDCKLKEYEISATRIEQLVCHLFLEQLLRNDRKTRKKINKINVRKPCSLI